MEMKFKIEFTESNVQDSVAYILVSEFDLKPNVLKAEISGDGTGIMIVSLIGEEQKLLKAEARLKEAGFVVSELGRRIIKNEDLCFSCGACVSICPTNSIKHDPETWEVILDTSTCIACGACVNSCSRHALTLDI